MLSNFWKLKFWSKDRNSLYFALKCFIWVVLYGSFRKLLSYMKSPLRILWNFKDSSRIKKSLNFIRKMSFLVNLADNLKKNLHLKSATTNLPKCKVLCQREKSKFGSKNPLFGYFWTNIWKNYYLIRVHFFWRSRYGSGSAL